MMMHKEIIKKVMDKINSIPKKTYNFEPLKIIFNLSSPVMLSYPWIFFDGLIAHIYTKDLLGQLMDLLPMRFPLDFPKFLQLPIEKTECNNDYIYHASASVFEDRNAISTGTIYKQFGGQNSLKSLEKIKKKKIEINKGNFKLFQLNIPINYSKKVWFYVCGDIIELEKLCNYITHLGKKRSIGYGNILSFEILKTDKDYSMIKDSKIMRTIPIKFCKKLNIDYNSNNLTIMNYKPPYWNKTQSSLCTIPEI